MKSGLSIGATGSDRLLAGNFEDRRRLADRIAESDIDHLFNADHISFHTGAGMDGLINAATLAAMMPDMDIMIGVYLLALRHPVPVARQLSSLALSAPGRIILGVGIGGEDRHEMEICGVNPARRGDQTNHCLKALDGLLSGQKISYQCDYFEFDQALIKPAPDPSIPVLIGGRSDAAMRRTANHGDGWLGVWISPHRFKRCVAEISDQSSRTAPWLHGLQLWAGVGARARENVAKGMEAFYRVPFERFEKYSPYGSPEQIAAFLSQYVDEGARVLNIEARGDSAEEAIDAISEVSAILHRAYPDL